MSNNRDDDAYTVTPITATERSDTGEAASSLIPPPPAVVTVCLYL
jgi:hypothetical protein